MMLHIWNLLEMTLANLCMRSNALRDKIISKVNTKRMTVKTFVDAIFRGTIMTRRLGKILLLLHQPLQCSSSLETLNTRNVDMGTHTFPLARSSNADYNTIIQYSTSSRPFTSFKLLSINTHDLPHHLTQCYSGSCGCTFACGRPSIMHSSAALSGICQQVSAHRLTTSY